MSNTNTIDEVSVKKKEAEKEITIILNKLQEDTGLPIQDISLRILPIFHGIVNVEANIKMVIL